MCDTLLPPPSRSCSSKCQIKSDTVCDTRCGSGLYDDYNCNWRSYGLSCRFCFNDRDEAVKANEAATRTGGSVIMCHTFEPPTEVDEWQPVATEEVAVEGADSDSDSGPDPNSVVKTGEEKKEKEQKEQEEDIDLPPHKVPFVNDVTHGELCAFMIGFASFVLETQVAVESVSHFMPGMRIAVATHAEDVSLFERTLGNIPGVLVSEAESPINLSPLMADHHCGAGTRLILYMNMGELLSRTFTSKDTHSVRGDLLVAYTEVERIGQPSKERTLATMSVLGFSSPSFSFGVDIMLPAEINQELRDVVVASAGVGGEEEGRQMSKNWAALDDDTKAVRALGKFRGVFVPEVLAALAYSRNTAGVWFINPQQWVTRHMFQRASIWDIPLVKPRFGCAFDITLSSRGYDIAAELRAQLGHFVNGGKCDRGFVAFRRDALRPKPSVEFGPPTGRSMPVLDSRRGRLGVSVVFYVGRDVDPDLLDVSLGSVVSKFPGAAEIVIVFAESPRGRKRLREVIQANNERAPFRVGAVEEQEARGGARGAAVQREGTGVWSALRTDVHCAGEFVMQMEVGDVLLADVNYDKIFHFGKPVLPYTRLSEEGGGDSLSRTDECIANAVDFVTGEIPVHDFALFMGRVYPKSAYAALRRFVANLRGEMAAENVLARDRTACGGLGGVPEVPYAEMEMSLLGSFLWHHMHDAMHWRALHRLDIEPDEWPADVGRYDLVCSLGQLGVTGDDGAGSRLAAAARMVNSRSECNDLQSQVAGF